MKTKPVKNIFLQLRATLILSAFFAAAQFAGATSYTWNVTSGNWSTPASWLPNTTGPLAGDTAVFGTADTSAAFNTVNNTVDTSFTISNLTYNSTAGTAFHVTSIGAGITLTVTNSVLVGGVNGVSAQFLTEAYMTGGGTFIVTGTPLTVENFNNTAGASSAGILNLTNLSYFVYNNSGGTISMGDANGANTRIGGDISLAGVSNSITALNINLATSTAAQAGPAQTFMLGQGTNNINVANFNIANQKGIVTVVNMGGGLRIRGVTGADTDRATITIGNKNVGGGSGASTGSLLLNGCAVNIKAGTLIVGENIGGAPNTSGDQGNGTLQFDTGTIDATNVLIAYDTSANNTLAAAANGTLNVGANATLLVGTGGISVSSQTQNGPAVGILTVTNGTVTCNGSITGNAATNAGSSTINLNGGTITVTGKIGSTALPINALNLTGGTLNLAANASVTNVVATAITTSGTTTIAINSVLNVTPHVTTAIPLIGYTGTDPFANLSMPTPPTGYTGSLVDNSANKHVDLSVTSINNPPVANAASYSHPAGVVLKIAIANLATNWSDADGDTVTLNNVSSSSVNSVAVTSDANYIYYAASGTPDSFSYTVTDGHGGTTPGTVNVTVASLSGTAPTMSNPTTVGGHPTFSGNGIPGYTYGVEKTYSMTGTVTWIEAGATLVGSDGSWSFTDSNESNPPLIFYRLYYPDNPGSPPQ